MPRLSSLGRAACALLALLVSTTVFAESTKHPLPIRRVVLFTSGVAFVEHRGEVEGSATIDFDFHVDDINDLLKSMVVQDEGGGRIETVTYSPQEPLAVTLGAMRVDPSQVRSLGDLLGQLRGEQVQIEGLTPLAGTIIAIDEHPAQAGGQAQDVLLLKTDNGLRSLPLSAISAVKLVNEDLDRDLQKALDLMASAHSEDTKRVSLVLHGEGKRQVRVGYIREAPVWKTSYRLVLDDKKSLLQGWAIVENTSEHDWENVELALVSGRPVSFLMDLYAPVYLARPLVTPKFLAGLNPVAHASNRESPFADVALGGMGGGGFAGGFGGAGGIGGGGLGGGGFGFGGGGGNLGGVVADHVVPLKVAPLDPRTSLIAAASGADVGVMFRFQIDHPVTLAKQKSALLPIINSPLDVERISLFDPTVDKRHPLAAISLTNNTHQQLMPGPLTVFDAGEYAGDAELDFLAIGAQKLVSYALDMNVSIDHEQKSAPREAEVTTVTINSGKVQATTIEHRAHTYAVKNANRTPRKVLIEHVRNKDWKITLPAKPAESTETLNRYELTVKAGETGKLVVEEEHTQTQEVQFLVEEEDPFRTKSQVPTQLVAAYQLAATATKPSPELSQALTSWRDKQVALEEAQQALTASATVSGKLIEDQERVRKNLAAVPMDSELYQRYLKMLGEQEDALATARETNAQLNDKFSEKTQDLHDFVKGLEVRGVR